MFLKRSRIALLDAGKHIQHRCVPVRPKNPWTSGLLVLFDGRLPIQVDAAVPAPELLSSPKPIDNTLVRAVEENESAL
jgi:hypothetical protein